jgi:hypothetical protein
MRAESVGQLGLSRTAIDILAGVIGELAFAEQALPGVGAGVRLGKRVSS